VVAAGARAEEVARARRRARWKRIFVGVVLAALIGTGVWGACFSSLLAVRDVRVVGAEHQVSADQVLAIAAVPTGGSLVLLDTGAIARRVQNLPAIASVDVERRPMHSVRLVIRERVPALILESAAGTQSVDDQGVIFGPEDSRGALLPRVRTVGATMPAENLRAALAMLAALPDAVRKEVTIVRADSAENMSAELHDGRLILWGNTSRPELKAQVLTVLLARKGRAYDVSAPEAPAITRR
jgi:cell division protein FtsQ